MEAKNYDELTPEEQAELRRRDRVYLFFAAMMMMVLGFLRTLESAVFLLQSTSFLENELQIPDVGRAQTAIGLTAIIGIFEMLCALGVLRLNYSAWKLGFFVTLLLVINGFITGVVLYDSAFELSSILNTATGAAIAFLLYTGRRSFTQIDVQKS